MDRMKRNKLDTITKQQPQLYGNDILHSSLSPRSVVFIYRAMMITSPWIRVAACCNATALYMVLLHCHSSLRGLLYGTV